MNAELHHSLRSHKTAVGLFLLLAISAGAEPDQQLPLLPEYWQPVPPVVTVGADGIPSDAKVLFDGKSIAAWHSDVPGSPGWKIEGGVLVVTRGAGNLWTNEAFGDVQLHVEWRCPIMSEETGQRRGNSGVFFMGLYEVQIMDSFENATFVNGQAASIYKQFAPLVNASRRPLEWQSYEIVFIAPRFAESGEVVSPARVTVFHNGVLVHHDVALSGPTLHRGAVKYHPHEQRLPLMLQNHYGDPVAFRNIWIRKLQPPLRLEDNRAR